jgi:hypothetical protein
VIGLLREQTMDAIAAVDIVGSAAHYDRIARLALNKLPDQCAHDVGELAKRIGVEKLELITWARADIGLARLIASKVAT